MRNILLSIIILISSSSFGQSNIKFKFPNERVITDLNDDVIDRGDQFDVFVYANGNNDTQTRQLLFDLQFDIENFELISVSHTGTVNNGGILPQNSNPQLSFQNYPGYAYAGNTTTTNGSLRYQSGLGYTYVNGGNNSIIRATLTWASTSGIVSNTDEKLLSIRFRLRPNSTSNSFNPIKLNFVAAWSGQGAMVPTIMESPLSTEVIMSQNTGKLVTTNVDVNSNLLSLTNMKVSFRDTITNNGHLFNILSNGNVDITQSLLSENTVYEVSVMYELDKLYNIYNGSITVSDFTTAQGEFTSMGLDGGNGQLLKTGQSLYAADINRNKLIDGGDLPKLLAQVVGVDELFTLPEGYTEGSGGYMSLPTWISTDGTTIPGQIEWGIIEVNHYGSGISKILIDLREFNGTNILPENIKSLQLFDLYAGPVEFIGSDGTWATYKAPSDFQTIQSSLFVPYIRSIGTGVYAIKSEFSFNVSPSYSWGSINTTNWKDITYPKVIIKTGKMGTNTIVDLKYVLWGDVNRSHSSQVITSVDGISTVQTKAVNSLSKNTSFKTKTSKLSVYSIKNNPPIDVNLTNITVTSNSIEIPINVKSNGNSVSGLQFEFTYDSEKLKFENLISELPNTWYIFANSVTGKIKFGAIDQSGQSPINEINTPFKLKFSTIGNGVDILTSIKVSPTMDASSSDGTQLGINLNTTQIKLTGYNNF
jgi:hypothetical protein